MGETLFLAHRVPFPPDRGDKIRSFHVLRALAKLGPVHVGTFDDRSGYGDEFLSGIAASHHLVPARKPDMIAAAEAMAKRQPVSLAAFANDLQGTVKHAVLVKMGIAGHDPDENNPGSEESRENCTEGCVGLDAGIAVQGFDKHR